MTNSEWYTTTLGKCANLISGGTPSKQKPEYWGGTIPWVSAKDMKQFRLYQTEDYITENGAKNGTRVVPVGTIFMLVRGMTLHNDIPICIIKRDMAFNQDVKAIQPKPLFVDVEYLAYYLLANKPYLMSLVDSASHGTGRLNTDLLKAFQIELPPIPEQKAIASILSSLDDKIELNREMNKTLETMAKAIFKSWFVDFDPVRAKMEGRQPAGMDAATAELFPDAFEESSLGWIPKGWRVGKLGDIADNLRHVVQPENIKPGTPYIGLEHMPRESIGLLDWGNSEEVTSNKYWFSTGEILFGKLRPYFHKVGVAIQDGVCSTDILVIISKLPEWYSLVLSYISSVEFVEYTNLISTGTRMPRTNWQDMVRYEIVIPTKEAAQAFNNIVLPLVEIIRPNIFQSCTLASIRDTLLPKLLSGEIRVKEAEKIVEEVM